jgi:hypothetical protein
MRGLWLGAHYSNVLFFPHEDDKLPLLYASRMAAAQGLANL